MKAFLNKIMLFFFVAILIAATFFVIISLSPKLVHRTNIKTTTGGYGASLLRYREALTYGEVDLVFLGSSHCYRGFDTRIFSSAGISSFNMGSSAQTPLNSFYLLKKYYQTLKPKKIILESYWSTFTSKGIESSIDIVSNVPLDKDLFKMVWLTPSASPTTTYLYEAIHRINYPLEKELIIPTELDNYISGGFVQTKRISPNLNNKSFESKESIGDFIQLNFVDSIYHFCATYDIELLLISAPVFEKVPLQFMNYKEKMNELKIFSIDRKLQFINFNDVDLYNKINWDRKQDWYDDTHLTQNGVEKFNKLLLKEFNSLYNFPNSKK